MRSFCLWISCLVFAASTAAADEPGDFTHYVMALSWNAAWCEAEGDARNADQCAARHDHGWLLHGLWPQQENGWPEYCRSTVRDPSRRMSATMEDIMGSGGLAWYQWKKHGRCTGLEAQDYFDLSRAAYESIKRPNILRRISQAMALPPKVIEDAFLEANPELKASQIAVKCRDGAIREVRICLTKGLVTRHCTPQVARECSASSASFVPMR
ncbi:MAG: ribonuclease T2 [Pseudomonadota bacterium]